MTRHVWIAVGLVIAAGVWAGNWIAGGRAETNVAVQPQWKPPAEGSAQPVGDGVHDDTEHLQRWVDSGRRPLVLPAGRYRLTRSLVIDLEKTGYFAVDGQSVAVLIMDGPGPALYLKGTHQRTAEPRDFEERVWQNQRMPVIERLAIEGRHPQADGIRAEGTMQLRLTGLHLRKLHHGVHLVANNRNVIISDCHIYDNRGIGIYYDQVNLHQSNILGCHISYNRQGGIVARGGNVRNIHIAGCDLESNMAPEEPPTANILIDCRDSQYGTAEVAITGCTIQHNNPSPDSANIRIIGKSLDTPRVRPLREGNITITGNVLSDVQTNIHLVECRGVVISGNTLWQGYQNNLLVERSQAVVVAANNMDRNPRYDYGNTQDANNAVVFRDCQDSTISQLLVTSVWRSEAGIVLERCRRMNVTGCTVLDCDRAGLLLKEVSDSRVSDCLVADSRPDNRSASVVIQSCHNLWLSDNLWDRPPDVDSESQVRISPQP
ncbi:MAG: ATP-binding protein [Pirellulaceae bacterium]|nr:MAG: ATP-binding protein [Pirellulaceae bacterium]